MAFAGIGSSVEGIHPVAAALAAGRVRLLMVEAGRSKRPPLDELIADARQRGVEIRTVPDARNHAVTSTPQGVVAECDPVPTVSPAELAAMERPAIVALDHLEDPHNVGAIARTALASGMTGMLVSDVRAAPLEGTAFKASAGALERLPVAVVSSVPAALARLSDLGIWVVGLDADGDRSLFGLELLTEPACIVVGAEGAGLSKLARKRCDVVASIPMAAGFESLNASVAASLACFEVLRARSVSP